MPTISVPPAVNYQNPLIPIPIKYADVPPEGAQLVNVEIDWATMGGDKKAVNINLQNSATLNFSKISALSVDNSACGSDVTFTFPDTGETTQIPAYAPKVIVPVFTNQVQFFVVSPNAQSEDITRFSILNTLPPPIAVPTTQEQNFAGIGQVLGNSVASHVLIAAGVSGTLENVHLYFLGGASTSGGATWQLIDGNLNVLAAGVVEIVGTATQPSVPLQLQDVHVRFQNGLKFQIVSSTLGADSWFSINAYYRTP